MTHNHACQPVQVKIEMMRKAIDIAIEAGQHTPHIDHSDNNKSPVVKHLLEPQDCTARVGHV